LLTEEEPPAKTTIGDMVEKIAGYAATTINQNMKGTFREADKKAVADAIQSKCPKLAEKVMKL
jgi:DNA-directed RNA polymerase beta subunit